MKSRSKKKQQKTKTNITTQRALCRELRVDHSRLRVLRARGLAARLATASHFDCVFWGVVGREIVDCDEFRRRMRACELG
jgi:hypothetical protein